MVVVGIGLEALPGLGKCSTRWAPHLTLEIVFLCNVVSTSTFETNYFPDDPNLVACIHMEIFQSDVSRLVQQERH